MVNKIVCNSVKWIGQNAVAVTVSLILPMVCTSSFKMCTKFCGTISRSTGAKYVLIVVKLNKNKLSKFIDFMAWLCCWDDEICFVPFCFLSIFALLSGSGMFFSSLMLLLPFYFVCE